MTPLSLSACLSGQHDTELNVTLCEWRGWKKIPVPNEIAWGAAAGLPNYYFPHELPSHIHGIEALGNCWECLMSQPMEFRSTFQEKLDSLAESEGRLPVELGPRYWVICFLAILGKIA